MTETIEIEGIIPAPPEAVCAAFLDARTHGAMTGAKVTVDAATGVFTAWDGYIEGRLLEVQPGRRILQSWRSSDFPDDASDSRLELSFERAEGGTRLRIVHSELPFGMGPGFAEGWAEYYFAPMQRFFARALAGVPGSGSTRKSAKPAARAAKPSARPAARSAKTSTRPVARATTPPARSAKKAAGPAKKPAAPPRTAKRPGAAARKSAAPAAAPVAKKAAAKKPPRRAKTPAGKAR